MLVPLHRLASVLTRASLAAATRRLPILLLATVLWAGCASTQPYQGMTIQEVFDEGVRSFEEGDWDDAIEAFETVLFAAPNSEVAPEARYRMGQAFFRQEEYVSAAAEFERFLERFPTDERAPDAGLGVCRSYAALSPIVQRDQSDTERAYDACSETAAEFAGTEAAERAAEIRDRMWEKLAEKTFIGGEFYFDRELYDSALIYYEDVVENYPDSRVAPRALRRMYEAYREIGYQEEAQETLERLRQEYPESEAARALEGRTGRSG